MIDQFGAENLQDINKIIASEINQNKTFNVSYIISFLHFLKANGIELAVKAYLQSKR